MHIIPPVLSSNEREIFNDVITLMIESNTSIGEKGHPEFDEFLSEHGEEFDMTDVHFQLVEDIILFEEIAANPEKIVDMNEIELMMAIFTLQGVMGETKYPEAKKRLINKLEAILKLKQHDKNQN